MGGSVTSQEDLVGKLLVPSSLLWECCGLLNSYLLFSGGQIPAGQEELLLTWWMKSSLEGSWIHSRATVKASLQPRGSEGKSIKPQLDVQSRSS